MKKIFFIFNLLIILFFKGQGVTLPQNFSIKANSISTKDLENCNLNIFYKLSFVSNKENVDNKTNTLCLLQVGESFVKFSEYNTLKKDSLFQKYSKEGYVGGKEVNEMLKLKEFWGLVILKNKIEGKITFQKSIAKYNYEYQEDVSDLKWNLKNGVKNILGYRCKEATIQYKGRNYTAWYSPDFSVSEGPFIFGGLPGIILEISDAKNEYVFSAIAVKKTTTNIYLRDDNYILKVSRDKYRELQKSYHDNPGFYHGQVYNSQGEPIQTKPNPKPYNPIELE